MLEECKDGEATCAFCKAGCDPFGDHSLCCKKAEFFSRHQGVVELLTHFIESAGVTVENDVGVGEGNPRPGELLMARWPGGVPLLSDVVVTHPLAPSLGLNLTSALVAVAGKEKRKISKYAELLVTRNLDFTPMALSTFGHVGEAGKELLAQAVGLYAAKHHLPRSVVQARLNEQLSVRVLLSVGQRLLAAGLATEPPSAHER